MKTVHMLRGLAPLAIAGATLLGGNALGQTAVAPTTAAPEPNVNLSRDDVERDLTAWKQSGVERNWNSDNTPDINSPEYIASYRKYVDTVRPANSSQPMPSQGQSKW